MAKYCCFLHPAGSFEDRTFEELCPHCGRPYGFPILSPPDEVGDYKVLEALDRGFYAATYVVSKPPFDDCAVVKVVPREIYSFFGKDFARECQLHHQVSQGNTHVVDIDTFFDADVTFGDVEVPCHIAVLRFVEGKRLDRILSGAEEVAVQTLAQIAIDLLYILAEFDRRGMFHNDLQAANIVVEELRPEERRFEAPDENVRTVAIDLGSVSDEALGQDPNSHHLSDIRSIAGHLLGLVDRILRDPDRVSDLTFRVARALEDHAHLMTPDARVHNVPSFDEMAEAIRRAVERVTAPWKQPLTLRRLSHYQNAQHLDAWHIPQLLEDPNSEWEAEISGPEPLLLKGMRGCGKTMLLRSLEFHARVMPRDGEDQQDALSRVRDEGYVGLYFPSMRLMDKPGAPTQPVEKPYVRLFVAYALQALRAVHHLHDVARSEVDSGWHRHVAKAVQTYLTGADDLAGCSNEFALESALVELQVELGRDETPYELSAAPSEAFPHLAGAIKRCSSMWSNARVLFLLDDVSTRYLKEERIKDLFSGLLFPSPVCSFKMTTEGQTFEAMLRSSGSIEQAMRGRDYATFDLGQAVNERLRGPGRAGQDFVERILLKRARAHTHHRLLRPKEVLGDAEMEHIARSIASVSDTARERKSVYHGLSALTKVCVGDISDVINIYDDIYSWYGSSPGRKLPVPAAEQTRVYQEHCSSRLLDLSRRDAQSGTRWREFARGFAEASYELLMQSYLRPYGRNGESAKRLRLRQYTHLYVRITGDNPQLQFDLIRQLIESGVFVLEGGSDAPRSKTRDSDPSHQFKLVYRKVFGLSNFIGIADSDRFELSGERLEKWLNEPENCKQILLKNLATEGEPAPLEVIAGSDVAPANTSRTGKRDSPTQQLDLGIEPPVLDRDLPLVTPQRRVPDVVELLADAPQLQAVRSVVVGLGFEERTYQSAKRLLDRVAARHALAIGYPQEPGGRSADVKKLVLTAARDTTIIDYPARDLVLPSGPCAIDITGLAKPVLFNTIRSALRRDGEVYVVHTNAEVSWPREEDLEAALAAADANDDDALWKRLGGVYSGEDGPYEPVSLMVTDSDETRRRVLSAAASPRSARLLRLLDQMSYDELLIFVSSAKTARGEVARRTARLAKRQCQTDASPEELDMQEVAPMLERLGEQHTLWFSELGYNFELGLTGSKMHAVACAAAAATLRISRAWYVSPAKFDPTKFTEGTGATRFLRLTTSSTVV